jgi:pimeloyl-ACP methyl ester carboxylesterase
MSQSFPPPPPPPGLPSAVPSRTRTRVVAVIVVGVLVLAAGVGGAAALVHFSNRSSGPSAVSTPSTAPATSPAPSSATAAPTPDLAPFYSQKLDWKKCGRDFCTHLKVPLDYANPSAVTIKLAVLMVPAQKKSARIGALVVNPGGPGGSGVTYAASGSLQFGNPLSDHFDIVGFDPRGVGQSDPLDCLSTGQLDRLLAFDPDPDTRSERDQMDQLVRAFGQGCLDKSGDLARHMSTREAARDMDILRAALGEPKLDYLGASYGTFLGATYADLFPQRVGRFVLDGAIDPALSNEQLTLQQAGGFETALRAYVGACVARGGCFLGGSVADGVNRIQQLLAEVEKTPLATTDGKRPLTEGLAMIGIWTPLYVKEAWPQLDRALSQAIQDHRGTALLALADLYASRGPDSYSDNSMVALYAVNCLDHDDFIPTAQVPAHFAQFEKVSPTFGRAFAFSLATCSDWPIRSGQHTVALHARGAAPIVVVGTTRDPATPLAWAQALARELDSGRLITRDGDGHTGFQRGNSCVDDAVQNWLIDGKVPHDNLRC